MEDQGENMEDFKQELLENGYRRQEELTFADCDRTQRVRLGALLSKVAAFAGYDYDARGLTYEYLYRQGEVFLLSRLALRVHRCPRAREVLTITTRERGIKGPHMQRIYEMEDRQGRGCISVISDWILVDPVSRKILRPTAFTAKAIGEYSQEVDCPEPMKVALPREGLEPLGQRRVVWSDLDGNGHLFSGKYGDIVWDALPGDMQPLPLKTFFINYSREATLGQCLELMGHREEYAYRMEGIGPRGTCFTALCEFGEENA